MTVTKMNRWQITHATPFIYEQGWFVVYDITGLVDSQFVRGYANAVWLRDILNTLRKDFKVVS